MRPPRIGNVPWSAAVALALGLLASVAAAQSAGEVEFSRGVGFAQAPGQTPRTLGKGLELREGDRLTTSHGSSAIVRLLDGTRMTVRPNSELVISQYKFRDGAQDNSMLMQLVRGGFRAITGLITRNSPHAARVQTSTATIGIRGTDFDARICTRDCAEESARVPQPPRPNAVLASAKLLAVQGEVNATNAGGQRRRLVDGGSVYPGDLVETAGGAAAVLVFRDDSRVSLGAGTRFRVDNFVYDERNAADGRFLVSLLRGSLRAVSGLIARANNRNVGFSTATATIGIRGTEWGASCADDGSCDLWTWLGSIVVTPNGQSALQVLAAGQGLLITPTSITPLNTPPGFNLTDPNSIQVPPNLFSHSSVTDADEGLFVFVRDGHIEVLTAKEALHLGKGEAGWAGSSGDTGRPGHIPKFIDFDQVPMPDSRNPLLFSVLGDAGIRPASQCR
jgi:hypothetical protein